MLEAVQEEIDRTVELDKLKRSPKKGDMQRTSSAENDSKVRSQLNAERADKFLRTSRLQDSLVTRLDSDNIKQETMNILRRAKT